MTALPAGITQADLDRYVKLDAAMKRAKIEHDALNAKIKDAFPNKGTYVCGDVLVERSEAHGFDAKEAAKRYPYDLHPTWYVVPEPVLDPTKVSEAVKTAFATTTQRLSVKAVTK